MERAPHQLRDGLETLTAADKGLSAHFFNVGQGDCFLVVSGEWSMLFDGGNNPSREVLEELARHIPSTGDDGPRLDVLSISHYDDDHIAGAAKIVDYLDGRVGHAFLPPFLNPMQAMNGSTRMLAERLREHQLGEELGVLDALAEGLASRTDDADIAPEHLLGKLREMLGRDDTDLGDALGGSGAPSPESALAAFSHLEQAGLPNLTAIVAAVLRMLQRGTQAGLDHETMWAAMANGANPVIGAKAAVGKQAIKASGLDELVKEMCKHDVPFTTPLAADPATWFGSDCQICQLAPLPSRVNQHAHRLPVAVMEMLAADASAPLSYPGPLGASNELSSVFAIRTHRSWSSGILASADAPLVPVPVKATPVLESCSLIKWPHHGGRSGEFADRVIEASSEITANSTHIFTTNGKHAIHHPRPSFNDWMRGIAAHRHIDLRVTFANAPHPSLLNCPKWTHADGPLCVSYAQATDRPEWRALTSQALTCCCW